MPGRLPEGQKHIITTMDLPLNKKYGNLVKNCHFLDAFSDEQKEKYLSDLRSAEFMDLTVDYAFKYVFGRHPDLLKMLLQDFLQIKIKDLSYQEEELTGSYVQDRHIIMDVACTLTDGRHIVIEMQNRTSDDLKNRLFYYGSALIYNQLKRGDDAYDYKPVYVLIFLNEVLKHDAPADRRLVYRYRMQERETGEVYGDQLQIVCCELPNLSKGSDEKMNPIEQWFYYFRNMKNFTTLAGGPKLLDERYRGLIDASKTRRFTDEEWEKYLQAMFTQREIDNYTAPAYRKGVEEGIKQGLEQGLEQGAAQRNIEIARAMLAKGFDTDTIADLTGLDAEDIKAL